MHLAGLDFGGTNLKICLLQNGEAIHFETKPTPVDEAALIPTLYSICELIDSYCNFDLDAMGIGLPGLISDKAQNFFPHIPGLSNVDIAEECRRIFGVPIRVDNDANCAAIAELTLIGASRSGYDLVVTLGTGIGASISGPNGHWSGFNGFAGEVGHMCISVNGRRCPCGRKGCWERYASASSLQLDMGRSGLRNHTIESIFDKNSGADKVTQVRDRFCYFLALGLSNIIGILDVERIVLTGGIAGLLAPHLITIDTYLRSCVEGIRVRCETKVIIGELLETSGAIGAAYLWLLGDQ